MKNFIPIFSFFVFFLVVSSIGVMASSDSLVFKQYSCATLRWTCGNCTYSNITSVAYPNGTALIGEVTMTQTGVEYSYYSCNLTKVNGAYEVHGKQDLNGVLGVWNSSYIVTPTGTLPGSFLNNPVLLILGLIGLALIIAGASKGIPWFGFIGSIMFLMSGIYTMIFGFDNVNTLYTQSAALVMIGVSIIFMFLSVYEFFAEDDDTDDNGGEDYDEED